MLVNSETIMQRSDEPNGIATHMINGTLYKVRIFFPKENAETLQQKYEQLLRGRVISELQKQKTLPATVGQ